MAHASSDHLAQERLQAMQQGSETALPNLLHTHVGYDLDSACTVSTGPLRPHEIKWHLPDGHAAGARSAIELSQRLSQHSNQLARESCASSAPSSTTADSIHARPRGWLQRTQHGFWAGPVFMPNAWLTDKFDETRLPHAMAWSFYTSRLLTVSIPIVIMFISFIVSVADSNCRCAHPQVDCAAAARKLMSRRVSSITCFSHGNHHSCTEARSIQFVTQLMHPLRRFRAMCHRSSCCADGASAQRSPASGCHVI